MQCDECHEREAVIALTQIVNEQVSTLHLCEKCAAERGVESQALVPKTPLGSFLAAMGKETDEKGGGASTITACPQCGATLQDFREAGRLGCPACYVPSVARCETCYDGFTARCATWASAMRLRARRKKVKRRPPQKICESSCGKRSPGKTSNEQQSCVTG